LSSKLYKSALLCKTKPICRGAQNEGKFGSNKVLWRYGRLDDPAEQTQTKPISVSSFFPAFAAFARGLGCTMD